MNATACQIHLSTSESTVETVPKARRKEPGFSVRFFLERKQRSQRNFVAVGYNQRRVLRTKLPLQMRHDDAIVATVASEFKEVVMQSFAEGICAYLSGYAVPRTKNQKHNDSKIVVT